MAHTMLWGGRVAHVAARGCAALGWLARPLEEVGQLTYGGSLHAWHHVGVSIEGERDRVVAQALGDDLGVDACLEEQRGVRVAEIVQPYRSKPGSGDAASEELAEPVRMQPEAVLTRHDEVEVMPGCAARQPVLGLRRPPAAQHRYGPLVQVDHTAAAVALRL